MWVIGQSDRPEQSLTPSESNNNNYLDFDRFELTVTEIEHRVQQQQIHIFIFTNNKAEKPINCGSEERGGRRTEGGGRRKEEGGKMQFITTSARNVFVNIVQIFKSNIIVTF